MNKLPQFILGKMPNSLSDEKCLAQMCYDILICPPKDAFAPAISSFIIHQTVQVLCKNQTPEVIKEFFNLESFSQYINKDCLEVAKNSVSGTPNEPEMVEFFDSLERKKQGYSMR